MKEWDWNIRKIKEMEVNFISKNWEKNQKYFYNESYGQFIENQFSWLVCSLHLWGVPIKPFFFWDKDLCFWKSNKCLNLRLAEKWNCAIQPMLNIFRYKKPDENIGKQGENTLSLPERFKRKSFRLVATKISCGLLVFQLVI